MERVEPMLVTETMALRSLMGAYPSACCTAWPTSWAATPMAAMEGLPYTESERRTTRSLGS